MPNYDLVAGDSGSVLRVTIRDNQTQKLIDLTSKSAKLRYDINRGNTVERDMTVLDQITNRGMVEYNFLAADLSTAGQMRGEVRLQAGQADQLTTVGTFHLAIKAPLP